MIVQGNLGWIEEETTEYQNDCEYWTASEVDHFEMPRIDIMYVWSRLDFAWNNLHVLDHTV